jgi:hypothetical protein
VSAQTGVLTLSIPPPWHAFRSDSGSKAQAERRVDETHTDRAVGRQNLRNRREHSVEYIRTKLAIPDFVLAHVDYRYFELPNATQERFATRRLKDISLTGFPSSLLQNLLSPLWSLSVSSIPG